MEEKSNSRFEPYLQANCHQLWQGAEMQRVPGHFITMTQDPSTLS